MTATGKDLSPQAQAETKHTTLQAVISRAEAAEADWQAREKLNAELLAALKAADHAMLNWYDKQINMAELFAQIKAAIAKAEKRP